MEDFILHVPVKVRKPSVGRVVNCCCDGDGPEDTEDRGAQFGAFGKVGINGVCCTGCVCGRHLPITGHKPVLHRPQKREFISGQNGAVRLVWSGSGGIHPATSSK